MSNTVEQYAILIGIADYQYIPSLTKAMIDARDMYDVLVQNGYPEANIRLLLDGQATKLAVREQLAWLAKQVGPGDTVVFFFSGHGVQVLGDSWAGEYLCPHEASLDYVKQTCISNEELTASLHAIRASRVAVFLDACHAGGVGEPKNPIVQMRAGLSERVYQQLATERGRVIIASSRPDEVSWELAEMRNGLFSHYLLKGLRGDVARPDGTVWMSSLFGYIYASVSRTHRQHPFQKSSGEDFAVTTAQQPPPAKDRAALARINPTQLRRAMHSAYDRPSFEILCHDLGLDFHDLRGDILETKMLYLIDRFQRRRCYEQLVEKVLTDYPHLVESLPQFTSGSFGIRMAIAEP
jgi:hypothetical protein